MSLRTGYHLLSMRAAPPDGIAWTLFFVDPDLEPATVATGSAEGTVAATADAGELLTAEELLHLRTAFVPDDGELG